MEKLKNEQIVSLFESKGYKIIGDIKNSVTKILCEKDGYWYQISYHNLDYGKSPSLWGFSNIDNLEHNIRVNLNKRCINSKFISYKIIKHGQKKRILLNFQCGCGMSFNKILEDAVYGVYVCCPQCSSKKRGITSRKSERHVKILINAGYKIIGNATNVKNSDYVEVEDVDGYKGFVTPAHVSSGKGMSKFDIRVNKKHYVDNVNHYAELNNLDIRCLSLVKKHHTRQSLLFRCSCGNEFVTSLTYFQTGKARCEVCAKSISGYELTFKRYLDESGIKYIQQYALNQCRDTLPLPFDFFLPEYNCLIEIDGEGHYHPCNFNRISYKRAKETFDITKRHDLIKDKFCKNNDINLLRMPYTMFKDGSYKEFFQNFVRGVADSN